MAWEPSGAPCQGRLGVGGGACGPHRTAKLRGRAARRSIVVAGLAAAVAGCLPDLGVGRCGAYTQTPGTARIATVEAALAGEYNCRNEPVRVLFDFTPTDPALAARAAQGVRLFIGSGENPPRAWVEASGLTVGSDHPAIRFDQPVGPCPPIGWKLTDVDVMAGLAACY